MFGANIALTSTTLLPKSICTSTLVRTAHATHSKNPMCVPSRLTVFALR